MEEGINLNVVGGTYGPVAVSVEILGNGTGVELCVEVESKPLQSKKIWGSEASGLSLAGL